MIDTTATEAKRPAALSHRCWLAQTQQRAFRQLLSAFSYPGQIVSLGGEPEQALTLALATLIDGSVGLCDLHGLISIDDRRRLGCTMTAAEAAQFVVVDAGQFTEFQPSLGSLESPEHGATLLLRAYPEESKTVLRLTGPGINGERILTVAGVHPEWWSQRKLWNRAFPLGADMIILTGDQLLAIPRTIRVLPVEER